MGTTNISTYDYNVNGISRRDNVSTCGTAFGTAMDTADWSYDRLGQVVNADHPTPSKNFAFAYDQMGNRQKSARNTSLIDTPFTANQGRYYEGATTSTALGGNALNQYGLLSLYGTATNLANTYDADGNQLQGRFPTTPSTSTGPNNVRTWDGENRLISATVLGGMPTLYLYDAFHRRVIKGTSSTDICLTLYNGWNPIADYRHTSSTILESTYTWGRDLSGTLQGAGGVGGLLAVQRHSSTSPGTYYPTYDGNGNVSEYLNTSGAIAAHYEYGPFGEITTATGPQFSLFRHRFSTKPLDAETGYYYYGYRLCAPSEAWHFGCAVEIM